MPLLRIRYRIQAFCGYEAEGVATDEKEDVADEKKGVATKSENASVVIVDAESESENVVTVESNEKASENVAIVGTENVAIEIGIGNAVIEKENALKKNVSAVKCPEQTLYILQDQYRPRYSFWLMSF
jgi:hypothetical protein